ncbi:MAG TPA: hypothetical protein VK704_00975 [Acidimicrobiales bacterium]|nr:hypothetical protein [Acidimicrobiales bacterium]
MSFTAFALAVGWVAVVLSSLTAYQQYRRMTRRGVDGVSFVTWTLLLYISVFWVAYGIDARSWQMILGCAAPIPFQVMIWLRLAPRERLGVCVGSLVFLSAFCFLPAIGWGWAGAVIGVGIAGWLSRGRQLLTLVRSRTAVGVSTSSWVTAGVVSILWVIYYVGAQLWAVLIVTAVSAMVSLSIATLSAHRHHRTHPTLVVAELPVNLAFDD